MKVSKFFYGIPYVFRRRWLKWGCVRLIVGGKLYQIVWNNKIKAVCPSSLAYSELYSCLGMNNRYKVRIRTWHVRTLTSCRNKELVEVLKMINMNICCIQESREEKARIIGKEYKTINSGLLNNYEELCWSNCW